MPKQKSRVILDTNLWISLLLTKDFQRFDKIIDNKDITLIFSDELLTELIEVSQRKKFKKYFEPDDIDMLLAIIRQRADFVIVTSKDDVCRDSKDNFLLSLAKDGRAKFLVTGDNDLLVLGVYGKTSILSITDFIRLHVS